MRFYIQIFTCALSIGKLALLLSNKPHFNELPELSERGFTIYAAPWCPVLHFSPTLVPYNLSSSNQNGSYQTFNARNNPGQPLVSARNVSDLCCHRPAGDKDGHLQPEKIIHLNVTPRRKNGLISARTIKIIHQSSSRR